MIAWRGLWKAFENPEKEAELLRELHRETGPSNPRHPLHGKNCRIVGSRTLNSKDFLLHLPDENRYARVHLTWTEETDPRWPSCQLFDSVDAVNSWLRG